MKSKFLLIFVVLITSVIGFSSGFVITKTLAIHQSNVILADKETSLPQTPVVTDDPIETTITLPQTKQDGAKKPQVTKSISCPKPKKDYEDETDLDVGQDTPLEDSSYIPSDLTQLGKDISKSSICVKQEAADALSAMFTAARKDGMNIVVSSGFRDFDTQKSIVDRETKNGNKNVSIAVAKPGYSEHQLGVAVDLTSKSIAFASAAGAFGDTKESKWLEIHASEYGFVQSYPKGKEDITGYMYEPWHYRYVGIDEAAEILKNDQTISQYLKAKREATPQTIQN